MFSHLTYNFVERFFVCELFSKNLLAHFVAPNFMYYSTAIERYPSYVLSSKIAKTGDGKQEMGDENILEAQTFNPNSLNV